MVELVADAGATDLCPVTSLELLGHGKETEGSDKDDAPRVLAGRYSLLHLIGRGGMGAVWTGKHLSLGTAVAIKLLEPRLAASEALRARFLREARAAATLKSANVVQILDHGMDGETPFIVMELLEGESLGTRLRRLTKLAPEEVARIFAGVGRAISRAHKAGIVHRDLKPDNIFLARDEDGGEIVKVVDFGIAKIVEGEGLGDVSTDTGTMMGTPHYMSPEQARGMKDLDKRVDTWALGVIAFECLIGRRPFNADAFGELVIRICLDPLPVPSEHGPVPTGFDAWFERATRRPIGERFQTVSELMVSLEDVLTPGRHAFVDPPTDAQGSGSPAVVSDPLAYSATVTSPPLAAGSTPSRGGAAEPAPIEEPRPPTQAASSHAMTPTARTSWKSAIAGLVALGAVVAFAAWGIRHRGGATAAPTNAPTSSESVAPPPTSSTLVLGIAKPTSCTPPAAATYMDGLRSLRAADWAPASAAFRACIKEDSECAPAAVVLIAMGPSLGFSSSLDEYRKLYRRIAPRRSELSPEDAALLDAMAPYMVRDPPDRRAMGELLAAASDRFPSAPLVALFASLSFTDDPKEGLRLADRALSADPDYADALQVRARFLGALGRSDEQVATLDHCISVAPTSECRLDDMTLLSAAGRCADMEKEARAYVVGSGGDSQAFENLAFSLAMENASDDAVMEAFRQQALQLGGSLGPILLAVGGAHLDVLRGRFQAADAKAQAIAASVADAPEALPHELFVELETGLLHEEGKVDALRALANGFFEKHSIWTQSSQPDAATPALIDALRDLGAMPDDEANRRIGVWHDAERTKAMITSKLWALEGKIAMTRADASRLLESAPVAAVTRSSWEVDAERGRLSLMLDDTREAKARLVAATRSCGAVMDPFRFVRAHLWLGQALERMDDKPGACKAYSKVVELWGRELPLGRTATDAKKRRTDLQCDDVEKGDARPLH